MTENLIIFNARVVTPIGFSARCGREMEEICIMDDATVEVTGGVITGGTGTDLSTYGGTTWYCGGGALIKGLDRRLNEKTGIPFHIAEDPLRAIARGTGIALKNINRFSFLMK